MKKEHARSLTTDSPAQTRTLGRRIGRAAACGTHVALLGDLACGKTVFVQGLAQGLSVAPDYYITSPTYTLINRYEGRCPLVHVDLYRLDGADEIEQIGLEEFLDSDAVVAIEWAERCPAEMLAQRLEIEIERVAAGKRRFTIRAFGRKARHCIAAATKPGEEPWG